jgi:hypothetical protein
LLPDNTVQASGWPLAQILGLDGRALVVIKIQNNILDVAQDVFRG